MFYFLETIPIILERDKLPYEEYDTYIENIFKESAFLTGRQGNYLPLLAGFLHCCKEKHMTHAAPWPPPLLIS